MRNPLTHRYPRELRHNLGKYLGLFLMMAFAVSFTSGYLLAAGSIERIILGMKETYAIEDGRFICDFEPSDEALNAVRKLGVTIHPDFYKQVDLVLQKEDGQTNDSNITARVYGPRTAVNHPAYAQGRAPESASEVAFDRVFCENHSLQVGDAVTLSGRPTVIVGILTMPDYQALFEDNNSFMFNAITFTCAQVSEEGYRDLGSKGQTYAYAFTFDDPYLSRAQKTEVEEDMVDALADNDALLSNFIDVEDNQGVGYALDDVQGDQTMWCVLLFLLVIIMGFVFVVLIGATIEQESPVIGTMLASGWRKRELVAHYALLPAVIGLLAASIGLAIGINVLCDPFKDLYYHSYSLPPYHTIWDWRVVVLTTIVPYVLLVSITLAGLMRCLRYTPLQFLRHEASGHRRRGLLRLPEGLRYVTRFRLRFLVRNASHFVTLFFGIMFASLLLLFGICMLPVVDNYANELRKTVAAPHQYVLKTPLELQGTDEQRAMYAAALRLVEQHDRLDANQSAVDALERLQDNDELVDALQRLQDNTTIMDALDRLQDNDEVMEAATRLQDDQELLNAAQRLQNATTMSPQAVADMQLVSQADEQTRKDLDLLANLDRATTDDLKLITEATGQTKSDLELLMDLDDATQADIDLVRTMDDDLLDDLRLAADIDEDAHVINTKVNAPAAVASAEKYAVASMEVERSFGGEAETITVYGIQPNSVYWTQMPVANGAAVAGRGLIEKTKAEVNTTVSLHDPRKGKDYTVDITDKTSNEADTSLYLSLGDFNQLFGNDADYFNAYASADELMLDDRYVASTIVPEDMDDISNQMRESMGKITIMMMLMSVPIYLVLVYLLTKTVIDRSARSISHMKVFGYHATEVMGLYIRPITLFVLFSLIASIPLIIALLTLLLKVVFMHYSGNFPILIPHERLALLVLVGMVAYAVVAFFHVRRIRRVPLSLALKVTE